MGESWRTVLGLMEQTAGTGEATVSSGATVSE